MTNYILGENHEVVPVEDMLGWCKLFEQNIEKRRVAESTVGGIWISTVFLGIDHRFSENGPPVVFETMAFRLKPDGDIDYSELLCRRCCTWDEAVKQHEQVVMEIALANAAGVEPE